MTPKAKAIELVDKFINLLQYEMPAARHIEEFKQCAIIAVDEILDENSANNVSNDCAWVADDDRKFRMTNEQFWQQVKQEIELIP